MIHKTRSMKQQMNAPNPDNLDKTFAALADSTRRQIVARLLEGDQMVSNLAAPFEMSLAGVSKHITILINAGLVTQRREGRIKWCRLEIDSLHAASVWMAAFGGFADEDIARIEDRLDALGVLDE